MTNNENELIVKIEKAMKLINDYEKVENCYCEETLIEMRESIFDQYYWLFFNGLIALKDKKNTRPQPSADVSEALEALSRIDHFNVENLNEFYSVDLETIRQALTQPSAGVSDILSQIDPVIADDRGCYFIDEQTAQKIRQALMLKNEAKFNTVKDDVKKLNTQPSADVVEAIKKGDWICRVVKKDAPYYVAKERTQTYEENTWRFFYDDWSCIRQALTQPEQEQRQYIVKTKTT